MNTNKLSIERIFWTDYITSMSASAILVAWGFFLFDRFIQPFELPVSLSYVAIAVTVAGIFIITRRIHLMKSAFEDGWEITGTVVTISFFRGRGNIEYVYTVQGQRYQSSNSIMEHRVTKMLQRGQQVIILANRENPKIAFIRDIYT